MMPITRRQIARMLPQMTADQLRTHLLHLELRRDSAQPQDGDQSHSRQIADTQAELARREEVR